MSTLLKHGSPSFDGRRSTSSRHYSNPLAMGQRLLSKHLSLTRNL